MKKLREKFDSEELFMYEGYIETKKACKSLGLVFEDKDFIQIYEPDDPLDRVVFCYKKHVFLFCMAGYINSFLFLVMW